MGVKVDKISGKPVLHDHDASDVYLSTGITVEDAVIHNKGFFATAVALVAAYPAATSGDYAIVGDTDTFWLWDADTNIWVDSGSTATVPAGYTKVPFAAATSVVVTHNFGVQPLVQCIDSSGYEFIPLNIQHTSVNSFTVTFTTAKTGNILANCGSPVLEQLRSITVDDTILLTDKILYFTVAGKTLTLPTAIGNSKYRFTIDNASVGDCYLAPDGAETINGSNADRTIIPNNSYTVYSNGVEWRII